VVYTLYELTNTSKTQGEKPYHHRSADSSSREASYSLERLSSSPSRSDVKHNGQSNYKTSTGEAPSGAPSNSNHTSISRPKDFGAGLSTGGLTPPSFLDLFYPSYPPLLSIPELSYTRENSPWVSSDSDSTYSTRNDEPRKPLDKFAKIFKKMEGKAWKSSAKFSGISPTISKDNTSGEYVRQAKLFAEFGRRKSCAFASSFTQHYDEGNSNGYVHGHDHTHSASSSMGGSYGRGRVSSMDMGIDVIINRPGNGR
jgi:hypothetical protein